MDSRELEKYSSAITLSDMEIFVFPELMYSLVLANIMSPFIWKWREVDCFKKLEGKSSYRKLMRLKQFIMDEFDFNLDLETWGLTNRQRELKRFEGFMSPEDISSSNALFGYHGDQYYFDVDIRRHFGLDKYDSDIIPYWKTETVEAMDAFKLKKGYGKPAGECVSLAALYAAAAFIVCEIPLEDIFMILTPLHSQNFIELDDGILTNNRRLVTKTMWFNGTEISDKAQRALRNEQVTIVAHNTGYIHYLYDMATIERKSYERFAGKLGSYLSIELTMEIFASFLRRHSEYQEYFQVCRDCHGQALYLKAEVLFHYEHGSPHKIGCHSHDKLLHEVSDEDFAKYPWPGRVECTELEEFIRKGQSDVRTEDGRRAVRQFIEGVVPDADKLVEELAKFVHSEARLPGMDKNFVSVAPIQIEVGQSREEIVEYLRRLRDSSVTADLAFYSYRDVENSDWRPFVKAAIERNPMSIEKTNGKSIDEVYSWLAKMPGDSIYDGRRLAQPDEVANYETGDGLEKAFLLANVLLAKHPGREIEVSVDGAKVLVEAEGHYEFTSTKQQKKNVLIRTDGTLEASS